MHPAGRRVTSRLDRVASFNLFSTPDPDRPDVPVFLPGASPTPDAMIGFDVAEDTLHFDVRVAPPAPKRVAAVNVLGPLGVRIDAQMRVIPDDFWAGPDLAPPPTRLDPMRSQRFVIANGSFQFVDTQGTGFQGFGSGRTFPNPADPSRIDIAVSVNLLGLGELQGMQGLGTVNGYITPPAGIDFNVLVRLLDPSGLLLTDRKLPPLVEKPRTDPPDTFLLFQGEPAPRQAPEPVSGPGGRLIGLRLRESLHLVHTAFTVERGDGRLRSRTTVGPVAGRVETFLRFDPFDPAFPGTRQTPIPFTTAETTLALCDRDGRTVGTLRPDLVEGRAFTNRLPGFPSPVYQLGGFGPIQGGTGVFEGVEGTLSLNGALRLAPAAANNFWMVRLADPTGRFRARPPVRW